MSGKFGNIIKQARNQENQTSGLEESQVDTSTLQESTENKQESQVNPPEPEVDDLAKELEVNLCVKVPISWRRHWAGAAKKEGITMTAVIIEALEAKFGKP